MNAPRSVCMLILVFCLVAHAQIITLEQRDGRTVSCMRSGLSSDLKDCGTMSDWYSYVFIGSITSVNPADADKDEKELQILPEELFHGNPPSPLKVVTSQSACLPKFSIGDRWLFFLNEREGRPLTLDYYGNSSLPIEGARSKVEVLRRLGTLRDRGLLRGRVENATFWGDPVPNLRVSLESVADKAQFSTTTDAPGSYEFQPLPAGEYKISVEPRGSTQFEDRGTLEVKSGACWDLTIKPRVPRSHIAGRVRRYDGSAVSNVPVLIIEEGEGGYRASKTDDTGYFDFDLSPGKYVIGIALPTTSSPTWKDSSCSGACGAVSADLYYPATHFRKEAVAIEVSADEKRGNIDFTIP
jgi:hypothetical protein